MLRRRYPDFNISVAASSKASYSHHTAAAALHEEWRSGLYMQDRQAFQEYLQRVHVRGLRSMGLTRRKTVREFHQN